VIQEPVFTDLLTVNKDEGIIKFNQNRLLLLEAETLFQMREELIQTMGDDMARSVLTRFGYRSGIKDVEAFNNIYHFENDADWLLAGPKMHTLEGIVHSTCETLEYDRSRGTFYMTSKWRNSYEAEQHLLKHGIANEPVCWSLTGYASGYASGFMGRPIVGIETMCQGMGDPFCRLELRSKEEWNGQAGRIINDLKQNMIMKSMQTLLDEERDRVNILQDLNNAIIDIGMSLESSSMPMKTVTYAQRLFNSEKAILAIVNGRNEKTTLYETVNRKEVAKKVFAENNEIIAFLLESRKPMVWENSKKNLDLGSGSIRIKNLIYIPLNSNELIGAIILINKLNGKQFTQSDQELLALLAAQSSIALGNARIYEQTNQDLKEKVDELYTVNSLLFAEHDALQKATNIHNL